MSYILSIKLHYLNCVVACLVTGCNTTNSNYDEPDNIFEYWKLDRIVYKSGEFMRPDGGSFSRKSILWSLPFNNIARHSKGKVTGSVNLLFQKIVYGLLLQDVSEHQEISIVIPRKILSPPTLQYSCNE